jgi:hypothetical protein
MKADKEHEKTENEDQHESCGSQFVAQPARCGSARILFYDANADILDSRLLNS